MTNKRQHTRYTEVNRDELEMEMSAKESVTQDISENAKVEL